MKKTLVSGVAVLFLLVTMATVHADTYTSTFETATGGFALTGIYGSDPITIAFSNVMVTNPVVNLPTAAGLYDWSIGLEEFTVTLGGHTSEDFSVGPYGPIYIGRYALPDSNSGSFNLGDVIIPFSLFEQGSDSLTLLNFKLGWGDLTGNSTLGYNITFTVLADNPGMDELRVYLAYLDALANEAGDNILYGIGGSFSVENGYLTATSVPEPATMLLLGLGLVGLAGARRKFKN